MYHVNRSVLSTERIEDLNAFSYRTIEISSRSQGWDYYDMQSEYLRMGVPNSNWTRTNLNSNYDVGNASQNHPKLSTA